MIYDDTNAGKVNIKEIKEILFNIDMTKKNSILYDIIAGMDTLEEQEKDGITFFRFNRPYKLKNFFIKSKEALSNLYRMFVNDN